MKAPLTANEQLKTGAGRSFFARFPVMEMIAQK